MRTNTTSFAIISKSATAISKALPASRLALAGVHIKATSITVKLADGSLRQIRGDEATITTLLAGLKELAARRGRVESEFDFTARIQQLANEQNLRATYLVRTAPAKTLAEQVAGWPEPAPLVFERLPPRKHVHCAM